VKVAEYYKMAVDQRDADVALALSGSIEDRMCSVA
jgi:hypothetical protein